MPPEGLGASSLEAFELKPRAFEHSPELILGEAEPPMRRLLAQELKLMRGEVDHQQFAAGGEQPRGFGDRCRRVIEEMQHLMQDHRIRRAVGERHIMQIAVADLRVAESGPLELHARIGQHRVIEIEAERAIGAGGEQLEDAASAGAEIDEEMERPLAQRLVHGGLDVSLRHMQRADRVPLARMRLEISLGRFRARRLHGGCARAVAGEREVGLVEALDDGLRQRGLGAGVGKPEDRPKSPRGSA